MTNLARLGILVGTVSLQLAGCGGSGTAPPQVSAELLDYTALLEKFPSTSPGTGPDVFTSSITEQPETLAYVLKAEAIRRVSSARTNACIDRLLALSDADGDGVAGWGIDQEWDAFGDGSVNPRSQVYLVSNAIVLDGLLAAVDAEIVSPQELPRVRVVIQQSVLSFLGSFTEEPNGGTFWYSTNPNDAINVPNVNAYVSGVIQKAVHLVPELFSVEQMATLGNRVDRAVTSLLARARFGVTGTPYWAYIDENFASPNDLVHHCYTLLGLETYRAYGGRVKLTFTQQQAADSILVFTKNGVPAEYPQDIPTLDPSLATRAARVWAPGFAIDLLLILGYPGGIGPFVRSLKEDYGEYPNVRYTPLASLPAPEEIFFPRIAAHCLPGLARRATGSLLY